MKKYTYLVNFESQTLERVGESFAVKGDGGIAELEFAIPSDFGIPANQAVWRVFFRLPGEKESLFETLPTVAATQSGDYVTAWVISKAITQKAGRLAFSLAAISGNDIQWNSRTVIMQVPESQYQPESEEAEEPYTGRLTILEGDMAQIRGEWEGVQDEFDDLKEVATAGVPVAVKEAADMINDGHIYIYTGDEDHYQTGHVYYYVDGTLTDGGQYGGTTVDATLTQSGQAADAKKTGDEISAIKEDLSSLQDATIVEDSSIDIGNLVAGSTVNARTGANVAVTYGTRTGYVDFSVPVLMQFDFDLSVYRYAIFTYAMHSSSSVSGNPTNGVFAADKRIIVLVPTGTAPCFRIGITRIDQRAMTTDSSDPESDFYKIKTGISFYRFTDATLSKSSASADAFATGVAIKAVRDEIQSGDICPKHIDGETAQNGITVVAKNGVYKISGTATANTVYNLFYNESALPSGIEAGKSYKLKVNIPSLYAKIRVAYYNGSEWSLIYDGTYDTEFTVPVDAVGFYVRFFFYNNGLNSPQFEVCPLIYPLNSIGEVEGELTPSRYPMMMTIIDDDGYGSFYTDILPLCISKCAPIASAIITQRITASTEGSGNGYMTWTQVQECARNGAEILSHGYNHKTDAEILADGTTAEQLEMWYRGARNDLEIHGIRSDIFVFNNNTANVIQCQQAARKVYKAAFHAAGHSINHEGITNPFYIERFNFTASTLETAHTIEEMKENIDTLATAGTGWIVWMIHTSSTNGWSSDEVTKLGQAIDYARSRGIEIVTAERGCRTYLPYQGI